MKLRNAFFILLGAISFFLLTNIHVDYMNYSMSYIKLPNNQSTYLIEKFAPRNPGLPAALERIKETCEALWTKTAPEVETKTAMRRRKHHLRDFFLAKTSTID